VLLSFLQLSSLSVLIGCVFGFACSYITKVWRFYSHSAIAESGLFMCFALMSYFLSEVLELSGIVTLLTCSLILSHYAFYNLSPQGKEVTYVTFQTLGYVSEAVVFGYIGVSATYYLVEKPICWKFILAEFIIVIIGRYLGVFISYYLFAFFPGSNYNLLSFAQLSFISYAALIRGAIAFGLILKVGDDLDIDGEHKNLDILESSTCFLVILTTVIFGSFTPLVQGCMLSKPKPAVKTPATSKKVMSNYSINNLAMTDLEEQLSNE
jgi:NhaP-type Na+/H+ or K+/H+ antiporter